MSEGFQIWLTDDNDEEERGEKRKLSDRQIRTSGSSSGNRHLFVLIFVVDVYYSGADNQKLGTMQPLFFSFFPQTEILIK